MMMTMRTMRIKTRRRMTSQNSWQDRITQNSHSKMMMTRITRMTRRSLIRHKLCKVPISVRQTTMMMISSRCRCRWMVKILSSSAKMDKAKMARNFSRRRECLISQSRCLTWSPSVYTRWTWRFIRHLEVKMWSMFFLSSMVTSMFKYWLRMTSSRDVSKLV